MERLLAPSMHRRVLLLNLLNGSNSWITSDYLAESIECSKKTIMLDCQYIEDRWSDYLTIETSRKHGIRLITSPHRSIHEIYIEIIQESNAFSLLESVFFEPRQVAAYWEKKLFLSNSSLYRLSNVISSALKDRNIQMSRSPYYVHGKDERQIRYFFTCYFIEVYGIREWPFHLDREKIFKLSSKINKKFDLELNDSQIVHLAYSIAVTIIRERQGFLIQNRKDPINSFVQTTIDVRKYQKDVEEIAEPLHVVLPDNWYEDFCYSIFWWDFGWDNEQEKVNVIYQAENLVTTIQEALSISISEPSKVSIIRLIEYIYAKHKLFPYKKFMVYDRYLYSSKAIKQNFIVFTAVVSKALGVLEKKMKFPWKTMYLDGILHEMAIRWQDLSRLTDEMRHQLSVLVLSDLGKEHAQLLSSVLKENFRNKVSLSVQETHFYEQSVNCAEQSYDLYVSNYAIETVDEKINMIVEDIPSFKNLTDLRKYIDKRRLVLPKDIAYLNA
ncbi:helix-turn-helix domain-containing protein [Enterococcus ureilyticus]|uniref:helix-turn-helix domain-containing protein n=1 Tax=Enterococcus ureilyticus TaxID=1131292 RepID=UPI001A92E717|nr:helix-turn-helix domain-containing protein [Enterococcus ureilyticus]MBO0446626.1 helix-turn-helix domain-containing protein [Enterococcus ureilyticus]